MKKETIFPIHHLPTMSFKAKDLTYENNEPAFLRKLRGEVAGTDSDRHERPIARPKRLKQNEDEDDGPTYVVEESGDMLSKADYEAMLAGEKREQVDDKTVTRPEGGVAEGEDESKKSKQQVAEAGQAQKKRKAVKIIGDAAEKDADGGEGAVSQSRKPVKKPKTKTRAVKLSFEDE